MLLSDIYVKHVFWIPKRLEPGKLTPTDKKMQNTKGKKKPASIRGRE